MFYRFSTITGRIIPCLKSAAYSPQGLLPYRGSSEIVYDCIKSRPIPRSAASFSPLPTGRTITTTAVNQESQTAKPRYGVIPTNERYQKIVTFQKLFCEDNGRLVWLKRGTRDYIQFCIIMALNTIGVLWALAKIYSWAKPTRD